MSVDDATQVYAALSGKVFSKKNMKWFGNEVFKATTLEKAFQDIITEQVEKGQQSQDPEALKRMMDPQANNGSCKAYASPITSYPIATYVS